MRQATIERKTRETDICLSLNIDGAAVAGMAGTVFFKDMARLRRELNEAGVPVRCEA